MATHTSHRFTDPESARLASLIGIQSDLIGVIAYCERLASEGEHKLDSTSVEAFSAAAVMRYARCFSTGVRQWLPIDILSKAEAHLQQAHEHFMHLRSKHIAHSVNPFEENTVTVSISDDMKSSSEIKTVNSAHGRVAGLLPAAADALKELTQWVLGQVSIEAEAERARLVPIIHGYTLDELKAMGVTTAVGAPRVDVSRKSP